MNIYTILNNAVKLQYLFNVSLCDQVIQYVDTR